MNLETLKDTLDTIMMRIRLMFSRGNVTLVFKDEAGKIQRLQVSGLAGELSNEIDHAEPYGLAARPLTGAEVFMNAVLGQRGQLTAMIVGDPRYRPHGLKDGEVVLWSKHGQRVWMKDDGSVEITAPAPVKINAPALDVEAPDVTVTSENVSVTADNVAISATSAALECDDIAFGGNSGQPVARVGDMVNVGSGSSQGLWPIVSGSDKMRVG